MFDFTFYKIGIFFLVSFLCWSPAAGQADGRNAGVKFPEGVDRSRSRKASNCEFPSQIVIWRDKPRIQINTISSTLTSKLIKIALWGTMLPICAGWAQCQPGLLQGYSSSIVAGLEAPPEGTLQPRHHYLAPRRDNHTVLLSFLIKVPLQLM